ncbi:hypothetical protein NSQ91_31895 [Paenibacillus sp. FSL R7-0048]|uniref:hypothetical protein n=1 Tax=Paenibacillus sp. FSL R7-0048 TaxID=2954528 RepID=UPI0030F54807
MLGANKEPYEPQDTLVIFKDDGTADVAAVIEINDDRLYAESAMTSYSVPVGDFSSYTGRKGRIFLTGATIEASSDYQRIAALERSTVLRQITHYQGDPPIAAAGMSLLKKMLIGVGIVALLIFLKAV